LVILRLLGRVLVLNEVAELRRHGHLGRLLPLIVESAYEIAKAAELLDVKSTLLFLLFLLSLLSLHLLELLLLAGEDAVALQFLVEFLQQLLLKVCLLVVWLRRVNGWRDLLEQVTEGWALLHARKGGTG